MDNGKRLYGLKVDANISFMFTEWENFIDRYSAASNAGKIFDFSFFVIFVISQWFLIKIHSL